MDIQSYIASGKLELFVLGELSDRERQEVIALSKKHPEIKRELDEIQDAMFAFDDKGGVKPSEEVKGKIFDTLEEELADVEEKEEPVAAHRPAAKQVLLQPWKQFAVASSIVAFLAILTAVYFAVQYYDVEERFTALLEERNVLSQELDVNQARYNELDHQFETLLSGDYERVPMLGESLELQKEARVDVFWDKGSQNVFVSVNQLASLDEDQDYQLWAIGDDGPVGIGIVKPGETLTLQQMEAAASAGAFAITIEPKGGSKAPTLENLVVIGEVV
ncbi:anti-sigma factor [Echinicola strongylocentroti]|uniref:Anti-sigma factor n=1 Tax=Echinicola strongylocentroti TaxID=1795355 RepID=A0A2Z4IF70_9BACT|nr:anti-sigma factor [Echinicola strongylocentroti]AWW29741.1 anti-sigma factor [Echinicola strongylocentroti]